MQDEQTRYRTDRPGGDSGSGGTERQIRGNERLDTVFTLLAARHRRYLLRALHGAETPVPLADVADQIIEWEHDVPGEALPEKRLRVYMSLYHDHVPRLVDAGVVAYSQAADTVDRTPETTLFQTYLEQVAKRAAADSPRTE
jgi:hypothetical protein